MKINRIELQTILENLRPGLSRRDLVDNLSNFTFLGDRICTFNDQIAIGHPFDFDVQRSVDGVNFYSVVSNIPGEEIDLEMKDEKLVIKGKGSKASLITLAPGSVLDKIKSPRAKSKKWKPLPKTFIKGIKLCSFSVSRDLTRPALTCVSVKGDKIFSADNLRISQFFLEDALESDFLIEGTAARILEKYPVTMYIKDEGWVHFKTETDIVFSVKTIFDSFPDVSSHFGVDGVSFTLPKELKEIVNSVSVVVKDEEFDIDKIVSVSLMKKEKKILCSGRGAKGTFERECALEGRIQRDISFSINPSFFSEVLDDDTEMTLGEGHALFSKESFQHVMCLPQK